MGLAALCTVGVGAEPALAAPEDEGLEPAERWLLQLDAALQRTRARALRPALRKALAGAGLPEEVVREGLVVLSALHAWHEAAPEVQQHPAVVARLAGLAEGVPALVATVACWLEARPPGAREGLWRALVRPGRLDAELDEQVFGGPAPRQARRGALRQALGGVAATLRKLNPRTWVEELLAPLDALYAEHGLERRALRLGGEEPAAQAGDEEGFRLFDPERPPGREALLGLALLGLGAVVGVAGLLIGILGVFEGGPAGMVIFGLSLVLCALGPVLILLGLILMIRAAVRALRGEGEQAAGGSGQEALGWRADPVRALALGET